MDQQESEIYNTRFYGKLLLFGEYGIILNSKGLAIPFRKFSGHLAFPARNENIVGEIAKSQQGIQLLGEFIQQNLQKELLKKFNAKLFQMDVADGIYFKSTIPQGYGAGSSGALVAAVYERYFGKHFDKNTLKEELALLENFFHGKSSGYDPLVSYLNNAILINEDKSYTEFQCNLQASDFSVFLVDTGTERKTKGFVNEFMLKLQNDQYKKTFEQKYVSDTKTAIDAFLQRNSKKLMEATERIAAFQLSHFTPLIPAKLIDAFEYGLKTRDFTLKFCGAGGGGYFLGFTTNIELAEEYFKNEDFGLLQL